MMEGEANEDKNESILKPKRTRNLTEQQRQVLSNRMREINDKRIADAIAKQEATKLAELPAKPPKQVEEKPKKKKVIKIVEIPESEDEEEDDSEEEQQIMVVRTPKKQNTQAKSKEKTPEVEKKVHIQKPKRTVPKKEPIPEPPQPPKVMFRFL